MPRHATVAHPGVVPRPSLQRWATGEHGDLGEKVQVEEDDLYEEDSEEESDEEDPTWIQPVRNDLPSYDCNSYHALCRNPACPI